jgi:hypothetical protein
VGRNFGIGAMPISLRSGSSSRKTIAKDEGANLSPSDRSEERSALADNELVVKGFRDWLKERAPAFGPDSTHACVAVVRKFGDFISPAPLSNSTVKEQRAFRRGHQTREEILNFGLFEQYCRTVLRKHLKGHVIQ